MTFGNFSPLRVARMVRESPRIESGREFETLQRLEVGGRPGSRLTLIASDELNELGVFESSVRRIAVLRCQYTCLGNWATASHNRPTAMGPSSS